MKFRLVRIYKKVLWLTKIYSFCIKGLGGVGLTFWYGLQSQKNG